MMNVNGKEKKEKFKSSSEFLPIKMYFLHSLILFLSYLCVLGLPDTEHIFWIVNIVKLLVWLVCVCVCMCLSYWGLNQGWSTEYHSQIFCVFILTQGVTKFYRQNSNLQWSCLSPLQCWQYRCTPPCSTLIHFQQILFDLLSHIFDIFVSDL